MVSPSWLDAVDEDRVVISVASIAELRRSIALMPIAAGATRWPGWLADDLPARFHDFRLTVVAVDPSAGA